MANGIPVLVVTYGNASLHIMPVKYQLQKTEDHLNLSIYEACLNQHDAAAREKYLKSGIGKRYLKNRLKRFLSLTG